MSSNLNMTQLHAFGIKALAGVGVVIIPTIRREAKVIHEILKQLELKKFVKYFECDVNVTCAIFRVYRFHDFGCSFSM